MKEDLSDQLPVLNLSLARAWLAPSVQLAASAALPPAISKDGFCTALPEGAGVLVGVFVAAMGVLVGVFVGAAEVFVGVFVGPTGVFVGVLVGLAPPSSDISSNHMSPVGLLSVISRSVTLVFEPLFQFPDLNCQEPVCEVTHN